MSELFEQEVEMEKRSSWGPLLLVVLLVGSVLGGIGYYVFQMKKGLSQDEATSVISTMLKSKGTSIHFHVGKVVSDMDEQAKDPHYKLLAKAGYLEVKDLAWNSINVSVTPAGDKEFASVPGFKKWENPDKTTSYEIPLATRELVKVNSITMHGPSSAKVEYEWNWKTTDVGNLFDASSPTVKAFTTWDRSKLIEKYGADFYKGDNKKETVVMVKGDNGWKISAE
ncbi:MAG TPA: hypothetical protein VN577_16805 [Terriglobales bacterium]|nr:hypothetical protein [Terriglobales bacterium]